jgi:hypothetical protein
MQQPAEDDTTDTSGGADPMIAVRKLGDILTSIRKVNINVQQRFNSSYTRIPTRPSLEYQFGLTESTGIITSDGVIEKPNRSTTSLTINADTGVQLSTDIDISTRASTTLSNTATLGAESETRSMVFPDVSVKWSGIEKFALFKPIFKNSSANITYKRDSRESGRKGQVDTKQESYFITPTMTFSFKNDVNSTLAVSYKNDKTNNRSNIVENSYWSASVDFKKDFRGGSGFKLPIPFLSKEIKWTSTLNTNLSITYTRASGKRYEEGSEIFQPIPLTTSLKISPSATYNFSRAINGRIFIDYGRAYAESSNQTTTSLRIGISAALTF